MRYDFSGYATKNDIVCSDGRIIKRDAFKHQDGMRVPLVWRHNDSIPGNILGHAVLENRADGVYARAKFNDSDSAKHVKKALLNGDFNSLSIFARKLKQRGQDVLHGVIHEVSLVLKGANEGAKIDNLYFQHEDGDYIDDEAIITMGLTLAHEDAEESDDSETEEEEEDVAEAEEETVEDIFNTLNEKQKNVVYAMLADATSAQHEDVDDSDDSTEDSTESEDNLHHDNINHQEGSDMARNVFETNAREDKENTLTHAEFEQIVSTAHRNGQSLKEAFLQHADYGIEDIDILFPEAKALSNTPDFISRRMEWVNGVMSKTRKSPFSRVKTVHADITEDDARALGYIKGNLKKEEVIKLLGRTTTPTTIYKKQKLDRDDVLDITDVDVVVWLKSEMRLMLEEEIARAILIGDGRSAVSPDKIKDPAGSVDGAGVRSIVHDHELYAHRVMIGATGDVEAQIEAIIRARKHYKGSGAPVFYTTIDVVTDMLLIKDGIERYVYETKAALASRLGVSEIVEVEVMEGFEIENVGNLVGIMVNLKDYVVGADKGGQTSFFDDFDIDYNQYKYLYETRISGALVKPKSAVVIVQGEEGGDEGTD